MIIDGSGFGDSRDTSYVEIGGSSLVSSLYLSWTDSQIKVMIPTDVQDGLVYVITKGGKSEPKIFTNKESIPVAVRQEKRTSLPVILSISPQNLSVGQVVNISGENFGSVRNTSAVYFTPQWKEGKNSSSDMENIEQSFIQALDNNFDYEYWSDTEIKVRVPDGAMSGYFFVATEKGTSNRMKVTIDSPVGTKNFMGKLTYLIELSADISDVKGENDSLITLRIPRPQPSACQPYIQMTESIPKPIFDDHEKSVIHHLQTKDYDGKTEKIVFKQNFVIPVYAITSNITASKVQKLSEKNRLLYSVYTNPDKCIPSDSPIVNKLASEITQKETNPYLCAKLIYDYIIENYSLLYVMDTIEKDPLTMIETKKGDSYDFAIIFCALARAAGIPSIPISGILVDRGKNTRNHWWCEIYLEKFGWFPVDPALGAGMQFDLYNLPEDCKSFYFGSIDAQHVAFSRGWNDTKSSIINNNTVYRPKTYALQSIWEEYSTGTTSYSSFWADPIVLGIY